MTLFPAGFMGRTLIDFFICCGISIPAGIAQSKPDRSVRTLAVFPMQRVARVWRMLAAFLFVAAGLVCGFTLGFVGFAVGVIAVLAGYAALLAWAGTSLTAAAIQLLLALLFLQAGYAAAIVARIFLRKADARWPGRARLHPGPRFSRTGKADHSTRRS